MAKLSSCHSQSSKVVLPVLSVGTIDPPASAVPETVAGHCQGNCMLGIFRETACCHEGALAAKQLGYCVPGLKPVSLLCL